MNKWDTDESRLERTQMLARRWEVCGDSKEVQELFAQARAFNFGGGEVAEVSSKYEYDHDEVWGWLYN